MRLMAVPYAMILLANIEKKRESFLSGQSKDVHDCLVRSPIQLQHAHTDKS